MRIGGFEIPIGVEAVTAQVISAVMGNVAQQQSDPLVRSLIGWVGNVSKHIMERWRPVVASRIRCGMQPRVNGVPVRCGEAAIGACVFCGDPVCLHHTLIDEQANLLCHKCLFLAAKALNITPRQPGEPPKPPPSREDMREEKTLRKKYLRTLGLEDPITEEELNETFRELMKENHPDRAPESKREAARKRAAAISEAYHWLKEHPARRAA